jgi:hypothetical protein
MGSLTAGVRSRVRRIQRLKDRGIEQDQSDYERSEHDHHRENQENSRTSPLLFGSMERLILLSATEGCSPVPQDIKAIIQTQENGT